MRPCTAPLGPTWESNHPLSGISTLYLPPAGPQSLSLLDVSVRRPTVGTLQCLCSSNPHFTLYNGPKEQEGRHCQFRRAAEEP